MLRAMQLKLPGTTQRSPSTRTPSQQTPFATLKAIRVTVGYSHSTGTGSVSYALNPNGQTVAASRNSTTGSIADIHTILATGSTTGDRVTLVGNSPAQGIASTLTGLAWTSSQALTFTFTAASTEKVTPIEWVVESIQ